MACRATSGARASGRRRPSRPSAPPAGSPVLAHFREAPTRLDVLDELVDAGLGGLEVHYRSFDAATVEAVGGGRRRAGLLATGGTDYHGDLGPYAEAHARLWVPPEVGEALLAAIA